MAKISQREKVLLGYSLNSLLNSPSRRSSEVDFSDVFGGPPRRSSIHEFSNEGNYSFDSGDDVEADGFRKSWLGLGEKPVFGDEITTRRRYPSEDFFDDIFRGDQPSSCCQSPRTMPRRDPFSSSPGSRVMSPARSLPPMVEPFASTAKFSLPARLTNTDYLASTSVNQSSSTPCTSIPRFNQSVQNHDVSHGDTRLSYRPSPLSHQISVDGKESTSTKKIDRNADGPGFVKDSRYMEAPSDVAPFHFSIYKWPSKGVPLVMSLRKRSPSESKEQIKLERCLNGNEGVGSDTESHEVDITIEDSLPFNRSELPSPQTWKDRDLCNETIGRTEASGSQSFCNIGPSVSEQVMEDAVSDSLEDPREVPTVYKKSLGADVVTDSPKSPGNRRKSNVRPLGTFLAEKKGNRTVMDNEGGREGMVKKKEKPALDDPISSLKVNKSKVHDQVKEAKYNCHKNAGKVHEFVKIFNQESSKKTKSFPGQSQSRRWQGTTTFEEDSGVTSISAENHNEMQASSVHRSTTSLEASEMVYGNSFLPGTQHDAVKSSCSGFDTPCPATSDDSFAGLRDSVPNVSASYTSPENDIMSKNLHQEISIQPEQEHQEETQGYERKIQQWSKGKEGNIRALLSTLQYVLWPNSGWKPVPLVDIIEANAVKRAYQKALLRLHPDKLQQKGAAPQQKFIAQKVFDILQEAWDHFNSLGAL